MKQILYFSLLIFFQYNLFAQDTIPFNLGKNNKIYIKVRINNSEELNFMFDTGADEHALKKSVLDKKVTFKINGKKENIGIGGTNVVETSSANSIQINTINKTNQNLVVLDYEDEYEDGIIGWTFFENKIVNINYGIKKMIIHDKLPEIPKEYIQLKCKKINNLFYIPLTLVVDGKKMTDWYELDTGCDSSIMISNLLATKRNLIGKMTKIGSSVATGSDNHEIENDLVLLDEVRMKKYRFFRIPINLAITESTEENNDLVGNNFLKRFHVFLDFKNNSIYLKVNNLVHTPYMESLVN